MLNHMSCHRQIRRGEKSASGGKHFVHLMSLILLIVSVTVTSSAQIPRVISYQGILTDTTGNPKPDGPYMITFRLYDSSASDSEIWLEQKTLQVKRGLFSTILGDQDPFGDGVKFDRAYWLGLQVESEPELSPRVPLTPVGYSLNSTKSDTAKFAYSTSQQVFVDSARIAGTIPDNTITTDKIIDGTIQRVDVAQDFTAPYSDTASYARVAPQAGFVDSARIAGTVPNGSLTEIKIANSQVVKSLNNIKDNVILSAQGGATITSNGDTIIINAGTGGGGTGIQGVQNTDASLTITDPNGPTATINVANLGIKSAQIANAAITPTKLNSAGASAGQAMIWNGSNVVWGNPVGSGLTLPYAGSATTGGNVFSITNTEYGTGIYGESQNTGVYGQSNSVGGVGVNGSAPSTGVFGIGSGVTGTTIGVHGMSNSSVGRGVEGSSPYIGIAGFATATSGTNNGVYGRSNSTTGSGLYGYAAATSGTNFGVFGLSKSTTGVGILGIADAMSGENYGVQGRSFSTSGFGVYGFAAQSSGVNYGVYGRSNSTSGYGLYGLANATTGTNYGVYGESNSPSGRGVQGISPYLGTYGRADATSGINYGLYGKSMSSSGYGVYGTAEAATGVNYGVYGQSNSSSGRGMYGFAEATSGSNFGVYGRSNSPDGGYGVFGYSQYRGVSGYGASRSTAGYSIGVYGYAFEPDGPNLGTYYAGYFIGSVHVQGTLSKASGSFKIDHPLDPENKYLYHSFVESPDMMNIYNGNIILNDKGEAVVQLPEWFGSLNKEFRYQLTCIGGYANVYISEKVSKNQFTISGGSSGLEVSWQVTGIRKDAYAEKHRIPIEEDKKNEERGKYLHPDAFGKSREQGIDALHSPKLPEETMQRDEMHSLPEPNTPDAMPELSPEPKHIDDLERLPQPVIPEVNPSKPPDQKLE